MGTKSLLISAAGLFLLFHFTLLFIYAMPKHSEKTRVMYWAQYYAYPFFEQSWSLFAPVPEENYTLIVEYDNLGIQKQDLTFEILERYRNAGFKGNESICLSFYNSIHMFEKNTRLQNALNGPVENDSNWNILEQLTLRYLNEKHKLHLTEVKLSLHCNNVLRENKRVYYNRAFSTTTNL